MGSVAEKLSARQVRVGIWGVFGTGSFGNEALLEAFIARLPAHTEPVVFAEDVERTHARHGVETVRLGPPARHRARGRGVRAAQSALNRLGYLLGTVLTARKLDALVVAGSGGLERYGAGAFGTPFEMWSLAVAGRVTRRPVAFLDIGVELLPRNLARFFVRHAGRAATYRSYRDAESRDAMRASGVDVSTDAVVSDLALSLDLPRSANRSAHHVIIGLMDYQGRDGDPERSASAHATYRDKCATLARRLREQGWEVTLAGGDDVDILFAASLGEELDVPVLRASTPQELVSAMSAATVVVAPRYHTLIMSLLAGTPAVSVGYGVKNSSIITQLRVDEPHWDIEEFTVADVVDAVVGLADRAPDITAQIDAGLRRARGLLRTEWDEVGPQLLRPGKMRRG